MPIPSVITDLTSVASGNFPVGTDAVFPDLDNHLRAHASFIKQNYDSLSAKAATSALTAYAELSALAGTGTISIGDALIGVKRTATSAVATTVHAWIEKQVFNVKADFGAVGDGVTDDSAAINAAIAAAKALVTYSGLLPTGGIEVHFGRGRFKHNGNIAEDLTGISFTGEGMGATVLDFTGSAAAAGTPMIHAIKTAGADYVVYFNVRDMRIDGKAANDTLKIRKGYHCKVENVLGYVGDNTFHIEDGNYIHLVNVQAHTHNSSGFRLHGQNGANTLQYIYATGCRSFSGTSHGWNIGPGADFELTHCYASGNTGNGFRFRRDAGANTLEAINIAACYADQNDEDGWSFTRARWIDASGLWTSNYAGGAAAGKHGLFLDTVLDSVFRGVKAYDNTGDGIRVASGCANVLINDFNVDANADSGIHVASGATWVAIDDGVCGATVSSSGGVQTYGVRVESGAYKVSLGNSIDVRGAATAKFLVGDLSNLDSQFVPSGVVKTGVIPFVRSAQTNNTFFDFLTMAIPNQIVNAQILINYTANSADGQLVRSGQVRVLVARYTGNASVAAYTESIAQTSVQPVGAETITLSFNLGAAAGGVGAEQTIGVQARINSSTAALGYIRGTAEIVGAYFQNDELSDTSSSPYVRIY